MGTAGVATHCPYCALQCGMTLVQQDGAWQVAARDFPTNKGGLCRKGWTAASLLTAPDRLKTPLARAHKDAPLLPVSWDHALDRVATTMRAIQAKHGAPAFAVFGGGGLTNEKAYVLGKFARLALWTAEHRLQRPLLHGGGSSGGQPNLSLGSIGGCPFPLAGYPWKRDATPPVRPGLMRRKRMPPVMQWILTPNEIALAATLIVVDPRRTETARAAALHLQLTPGTDASLLPTGSFTSLYQ